MYKVSLVTMILAVLVSFTVRADGISKDNVSIKAVELPGIGRAVFPVPNEWRMSVSKPNKLSVVTVKFISGQQAGPISFSLTFIPNKAGKKFTQTENERLVRQLAVPYVSGSVEGETKLKTLDTTFGKAVFASFNEKKYQNTARPPAGEYSTVTVGQITHSYVVVVFTILTNGDKSNELEFAKIMLGSFALHKP